MGTQKKKPFPLWQTTKDNGIENRYIRLGSLLSHPAWMSLSDKAKVIYIHMLYEAGGKKEFTFPASKHKKLCSKSVFQRVKDELTGAGFILEKQNNANLRKANIYEFTDSWKKYKPPDPDP